MKVLLLEDDLVLAKEIKLYLVSKEIACDVVYDGDLFFKQEKTETYDAFLLDINVPKMNGLDVCKKVRETNLSTPIIMLTAYGEIDDKVEAFQLGTDDYLVKPFHLEELFIRLSALARRKFAPQNQANSIKIADLSINLEDKSVERNGQIIPLTPKEFKLLQILAEAKGRVVSKQTIADLLWDYPIETNQNTIEVYINFLRNKIDKNYSQKLINTKVGYGYFIKAEV
jgi:DNA-binding response OmpR family regulator